jgi:hypothetical protein
MINYIQLINEKTDAWIAQPKDYMRISDIFHKADGDSYKEISLTTNMANAITDQAKAYRRWQAMKIAKKDYGVRAEKLAGIFRKRYEELAA